MAGIKISELPPVATAMLTDIAAIVQGGVTSKETLQQIATLFNSALQLASISQVTGLAASLASFLPLSGGTMTGNLILNGNPSLPNQAANKAYVDAIAQGFTVVLACAAGSTANLNATYSNGTAGVGATLTNAGTQAAFVIDGYAANVNDRILIKDQTSSPDNGIYTVTTVGTVSTNWVLTRATDYDQAPGEIKPGTLILINNGTVNATTSWVETATVTTIGTDPILFSQFTFAPNAFLMAANNLSDVASVSTSRTNLGLGSSAVQNDTFFLQAANNLNDVASPSASALNLFVINPINSNFNLSSSDYGKLTVVTGSTIAGITLISHVAGQFFGISIQTAANKLVPIVTVSGTIAGQVNLVVGSGDTIWFYDDGTNYQITSMQLQPCSFRATNSVNQTLASATITKINLNTASNNIGGFFNTSTSQFLPLLPGKYLISGQCTINTGGAASFVTNIIGLNGANNMQSVQASNTSSNATPAPLTNIIQLNGTTDFIELYAQQNTGVARNTLAISSQVNLSGYRISLF